MIRPVTGGRLQWSDVPADHSIRQQERSHREGSLKDRSVYVPEEQLSLPRMESRLTAGSHSLCGADYGV
ncbi:hypothetical protein GBF38_022334 [Nibea albiflora]|uniref:Uncharacterized protein n=1 Tax=Nibea albiflora TaxID=240163 RepID=A0ACB7FHG1_NIBAL|nr:hypothetical protein GBF38_022334 [Nibea albiflora]